MISVLTKANKHCLAAVRVTMNESPGEDASKWETVGLEDWRTGGLDL